MIRRNFLRTLARNAAGLYLAPDALELLAEPRRKYWPGADFGGGPIVLGSFQETLNRIWQEAWERWRESCAEFVLRGAGSYDLATQRRWRESCAEFVLRGAGSYDLATQRMTLPLSEHYVPDEIRVYRRIAVDNHLLVGDGR
jgi:hypothetical protein